MELRQINTFIQVVRHQSFSKAAESLGYSQSAVTVQIRLLEEELNTRLFDRIGKRIALTARGEQFLPYAYSILHQVNRAQLSMREEEELNSQLIIGTIESLCLSKLPPILQYFREHHSRVTVRVVTASPERLIEMMERNQVDLIYILDEPRYNNNWCKAMEVREEVVFVASALYEGKDKERVWKLEELLEHPFFLTEQDANYRKAFDKRLASRNRVISPFLESSNTEFIIKMLEHNEGISLLPYFAVQESVESGRLSILQVEDLHFSMYRQIFSHKDKWRTREMDEFIRLAAVYC